MAEHFNYAEKIAALLRKAESTNEPGEAQVFMEAAQRLMIKYSIDEAMLDAAAGSGKEEIITHRITYTGQYNAVLFDVGSAAAIGLGCKVLVSRGAKTTMLNCVGFENDVRHVIELDASLQIQVAGQLSKWWKEVKNENDHRDAGEKWRMRRSFIIGFADGIRSQFKAARKDVIPNENDGVALILRDRKDKIEDFINETMNVGKSRQRNMQGDFNAGQAGREAGRRARTSTRGKVSGSTKELSR